MDINFDIEAICLYLFIVKSSINSHKLLIAYDCHSMYKYRLFGEDMTYFTG